MNTESHPGEYMPAGEDRATSDTFAVEAIAAAFDVAPERVRRALAGEFGQEDFEVDSRQAQHLAEVLLGDQPQDQRLAALMTLGAYTPRPDHASGLGEKDPAEESDRLERTADRADGERG